MISIDVKVTVDLDKVVDNVKEATQKGLNDLVIAASGYWKDIAGQRLHSTKQAYQDAIQTRKVDDDTFQIYLHNPDKDMNKLVNMIEGGAPAYTTHLHTTLRGYKSMYWSGMNGSKKGFKWKGSVAKGKLRTNKTFMDIPIFGKGESGRSTTPKKYRRLTEGNIGAFRHKGFKPKSPEGGGLSNPIREDVIKYINEQAPAVFSNALKRTKA